MKRLFVRPAPVLVALLAACTGAIGAEPNPTATEPTATRQSLDDEPPAAKTCTPDCDRRICGPDGCGGQCGNCDAGSFCNNGRCQASCRPDSDAALCRDRPGRCGSRRLTDNCGTARTVDCGRCEAPETCGADHLCACTAESDDALCEREGATCGVFTVGDRCGQAREINCGACGIHERCGPDRRCECVPETDAELCALGNLECGPADGVDRCGQPRSIFTCGGCRPPEVCGGGGRAGTCGCVPQCSGKECGPDGCGGECGPCPSNSHCLPNQICQCDSGYIPDARQQRCVAIGGPCDPTGPENYCSGNTWVYCDPIYGVQVTRCEPGQCLDYGGGVASCSCGARGTTLPSLTQTGFCAASPANNNGLPYEYFYSCIGGIIVLTNCRARTGLDSGRCYTFVGNSFSQASCSCSPCVEYDYNSQRCTRACSGFNLSCQSFPANTYSCY